MKFISKVLTKIRTSRSGEAATVSIAAFLIFIARFASVPFQGDWDRRYEEGEKLLGFTWLSTALSRIGNELAWVFLGLVLLYATSFMEHRAKKYFRNLAALILIVAAYYLSWAFYNGNQFDWKVEAGFAAATAGMGYIICWALFRFWKSYVEKLKGFIRLLTNRLIVDAPTYVKDVKVWDAEIVEPTLDRLNE